MQTQTRLAKISLTEKGVVLYGSVTRMTGEKITLRLHTVPSPPDVLSVGTTAELLVVAKDTLYTSSTQVHSLTNADLCLTFSAPVRQIQRRIKKRYPCEVPISFRAAHMDGSVGFWYAGMMVDLGQGGLAMMVAPGVELPKRIEVKFTLNTVVTSRIVGTISETEGDREIMNSTRPIRALGRLAHCRSCPNGKRFVGVAFLSMSQTDEIRILRHFGFGEEENL